MLAFIFSARSATNSGSNERIELPAQAQAFAAIDCTLAPAASVHEIALGCRRALRWLHPHRATLGFDPARIVVAGSSAGTHLAAMACLRGRDGDADLPAGLPAAAVLVSGICELIPLMGTSIDQAESRNIDLPYRLRIDSLCMGKGQAPLNCMLGELSRSLGRQSYGDWKGTTAPRQQTVVSVLSS